MALLNSLVLPDGAVTRSMRLDDLLLRQIVAVLAPALLAEPCLADPQPALRLQGPVRLRADAVSPPSASLARP